MSCARESVVCPNACAYTSYHAVLVRAHHLVCNRMCVCVCACVLHVYVCGWVDACVGESSGRRADGLHQMDWTRATASCQA